jgi:hypothetical protein
VLVEENEEHIVFGEVGLTKVVYTGTVNGSWKGAETCHLYPFRKDRRVQFVDSRDVPALLHYQDGDGNKPFDIIRG